jgi:hypothetical protein
MATRVIQLLPCLCCRHGPDDRRLRFLPRSCCKQSSAIDAEPLVAQEYFEAPVSEPRATPDAR